MLMGDTVLFEDEVNPAMSAALAAGLEVTALHNHFFWAAFAGSDEQAVVDGDFAMREDELQPVLKAMRSEGINIVAIHQHMTHENPRILFLHYWGKGKAVDLARAVKKALAAQQAAT
jgi:hypothetical protein